MRQQQHDVSLFVQALRDFNQRQAQLFLAVNTVIARYQPPDLQAIADEDVVDAAAALAGTFETAARGVIYEHRPSTRSAERLATEIRRVLVEAGRSGGAPFERDAAVVLRRIEQTARNAGEDARAYLQLLDRVLTRRDAADNGAAPDAESAASRLILP